MSGLGRPARDEQGDAGGIGGVGGEELDEVLLFLLHDGEIDEKEDSEGDEEDGPTASGESQAEGSGEGAEIKGVTGEGVGAAVDEVLIFAEVAGGPAAEEEAEEG